APCAPEDRARRLARPLAPSRMPLLPRARASPCSPAAAHRAEARGEPVMTTKFRLCCACYFERFLSEGNPLEACAVMLIRGAMCAEAAGGAGPAGDLIKQQLCEKHKDPFVAALTTMSEKCHQDHNDLVAPFTN